MRTGKDFFGLKESNANIGIPFKLTTAKQAQQKRLRRI